MSPAAAPAPPSPEAVSVARSVFGLQGLRPGQAEVVAAAEAGRDVLFVAPTGSGKSVAYWVPGIVQGGLALVVSPLIALMTDQVERLRRAGVAAAALHSQLEGEEQRRSLAAAREGRLRFLYVAPERFASPAFEALLPDLRVARFVVDEAHCISSWGHDFRQDYRRLGSAVAACGRPPVTAVTATATPRVRDDISRNLEMRDPLTVVTGFLRAELRLEVWPVRRGADKEEALLRALAELPGRAIVYCGRTRDCEETARRLGAVGIAAAAYHGALDGAVRQRVQADFTGGGLRVVVATSAFGMGVDIPDIRQVIHREFPGSLETYYQEAGRAGRDGLPARCLLLYSPADRDLQEFFIEQAYPDRALVRTVYRALLGTGRWDGIDLTALLPGVERRAVDAAVRLLGEAGALLPGGGVRRLTAPPVDFDERERLKEAALARLAQMMAYASSRQCRHARIADYFGQEGVERTCAACDNCLSPAPDDAAVPEAAARAALRAVARFDGHLGAARLASLLRGADSAWTRERSWVSRLDFFSALSGWSEDSVRDLLEGLVGAGLARRGDSERPTLSLSPAGRAALRDGAAPELRIRGRGGGWRPAAGGRKGAPGDAAAEADGADPDARRRWERLRAWRSGIARAEGRPAFTVFDDRTLRAIASRRPRSAAELLQVHGVGPAKVSRYAEAILALLQED
jgi:ATP-dependent DNA helicase RecQ